MSFLILHLLLLTHEKCDIEVEWCIYLKECTVKTLNLKKKEKRIVSITLSSRSDACLLLSMFLLFMIYSFMFFYFFLLKNSASDCSYIVLSDFSLNVLIKFVLNKKKKSIKIEKSTSMEGERSVQIVHGSEAWWWN